MIPLVQEKLPEIRRIAAGLRVRRLWLFGSAADGTFEPERSDLDFVVEFEHVTPSEHADAFFALIERLESLFARRIDLIEMRPIRNPYFRQAIEESRVVLYDAA
jgi:predicted nucleotidyltransferase